jgi:hypothetical protein
MQNNGSKIWFPAKKYGWGWGPPCAWQGWVVMATWLVLLLAGGILLAPRNIGLYGAYALVLSIAFFMAVFIKGERPRWRWGESENPQSRSLTEKLAELEELRRRKLISASEYDARGKEILKEE